MDERVFKRINIFKGFIRTAKDYRAGVNYHVRKARLHNRLMHQFGVVVGIDGELRVRSRRRPDMSVEIEPGYAIDPQGCDALMHNIQMKDLNKEDFILPQTVYLVLRYKEEKTDFKVIELRGFPRSEGMSRVSESFAIDWTIAEPDPKKEIELCRILVTDRVNALRNAMDPQKPRAGEIDLRFVPKASICKGSLRHLDRDALRKLLMLAVRSYTHMARTRDIPSAIAAATACTALMLLNEGVVLDEDGVNGCLELLQQIQAEIAREAEAKEPSLFGRPKFQKFAQRNRALGAQLKGSGEKDPEARLEVMAKGLDALGDGLGALYDVVRPPDDWRLVRRPVVPGQGILVLDGTEWDALKECGMWSPDWPAAQRTPVPPERLVVEGQEWAMIDAVNVLDRDSMASHRFAIKDASDWWRSQVRLKYPDQTEVRDDGIGHEGGYAEWQIHNVTPGRPLVIVRRMDYARADYQCTVWINDTLAGDVPCGGQDTRYRWRNWPFGISAPYVKTQEVRIRQYIDVSNRDVNYFRLWFYQPV